MVASPLSRASAGVVHLNHSREEGAMTSNSEQEVLARHRAQMGDALGELYFHLWKDLVWLHLSWREYRVLFGTSEETVELLNSVAPRFFYNLDYLMWHDALLRLTRLTDNPKSRGKENLTIQRLPGLIADAELRVKVDALVAGAVSATGFARDWRDRHLAHRDLSNTTAPEAHPLAAASRATVEEALKSLRDVLNCVLGHYEDTMAVYDSPMLGVGGAFSLLRALRQLPELPNT